MEKRIQLEPAANKVCDSSAQQPYIFQLPPEEGREVLEKAQDEPVFKYPVRHLAIPINTRRWGAIKLHMVEPQNLINNRNAIFYIHGAGWVFGSYHTHEKLVCELAHRTNSVIFFPEYSLSPEAKYPMAIEQCYYTMCNLPTIAWQSGINVNFDKFTVAGDSVGGNIATVMTIMAKQRKGPKIHKQVLFYPVTNSDFNTKSYREFGEGYYLYKEEMMWFWEQYTNNTVERAEITASPLKASIEELTNLPMALIINGEADVLRDEGESYARKLRAAGVKVTAARFQAIIHDFVMLNSLDQTNACRGAMDLATSWINQNNRDIKDSNR